MKKNLTVLLFYILFSGIGFSQTSVPPGNVSGNWLLTGSPYLITGDIAVASGSSLIIEPGVIVRFQGNYKLTVNGRISAIGTVNDTILFTAQDTSIGWHGIRFFNIDGNGMDSSRFIYCRFTAGKLLGPTTPDSRGGAIYAEGSSKILFRNCLFDNNYAAYDGGAVCLLLASNADFQNCVFNYNMCGFYGAALYVDASHPKIRNCTLSNGYASFFGGGLAGWNGSMLRLENCKVINNKAGAVCGIYTAANSSPVLVNCLFSNNISNLGNGGGMGFSVSNATIINCTIVNNSANIGGAGLWIYNSPSTLKNCIVWNNYPDGISVTGTAPVITYSDLQTGFAGTGNISLNPAFVGSGDNPYSILETSPCRNAGALDTAGLMLPAFDLAGNPRVCEDTVDMGAYEFYVPIPVELASFSASSEGNSVMLKWMTASENNNYGFEVERNSGEEWQKLEFVPGKVNSLEINNYSYIDNDLQPGLYLYRLKQLDLDGTVKYYTLSEKIEISAPEEFILSQNYPNPFNPSTLIKYSLPVESGVRIILTNSIGEVVKEIIPGVQQAGVHELVVNSNNLSSGIYFYTIEAVFKDGNFRASKKMILIK